MVDERILAIDPSTKALAWALGPAKAPQGAKWTFGTLPLHEDRLERYRQLQAFFEGMAGLGVQRIAYEDCYLGVNPKTFGVLSGLKSEVMTAAATAGLGCLPVSAVQWQTACLTSDRRAKRDQLKRLSEMYARDVLKAYPGSQDLCDAVCIGCYVTKGLDCDELDRRTLSCK